MITIDKSTIKIEGKFLDIMTEYTTITHKMLELLEQTHSREEALSVLDHAFELGKKSREEISAESKKLIHQMIDKVGFDGLLDLLGDLFGGLDEEEEADE